MLEFGAVSLAPRLLVSVHLMNGAVLLGEGPQLMQLVLGVLALILRRHAGIDGNSHNKAKLAFKKKFLVPAYKAQHLAMLAVGPDWQRRVAP